MNRAPPDTDVLESEWNSIEQAFDARFAKAVSELSLISFSICILLLSSLYLYIHINTLVYTEPALPLKLKHHMCLHIWLVKTHYERSDPSLAQDPPVDKQAPLWTIIHVSEALSWTKTLVPNASGARIRSVYICQRVVVCVAGWLAHVSGMERLRCRIPIVAIATLH